ncbi:hypothetical protein [Variovorax sp. MHTC-1]|uniref:hypothetical protein n=1 Tax=Variovorax sp. MHTC-1 TaxID=2495593 RepID=UPI000F862C14|nr:hypothetical protein [Variovorax sp. MHTC-1]RST51458.1 hypothetical protein EJI01_18785 [Variovorax sp. MHTC-1]
MIALSLGLSGCASRLAVVKNEEALGGIKRLAVLDVAPPKLIAISQSGAPAVAAAIPGLGVLGAAIVGGVAGGIEGAIKGRTGESLQSRYASSGIQLQDVLVASLAEQLRRRGYEVIRLEKAAKRRADGQLDLAGLDIQADAVLAIEYLSVGYISPAFKSSWHPVLQLRAELVEIPARRTIYSKAWAAAPVNAAGPPLQMVNEGPLLEFGSVEQFEAQGRKSIEQLAKYQAWIATRFIADLGGRGGSVEATALAADPLPAAGVLGQLSVASPSGATPSSTAVVPSVQRAAASSSALVQNKVLRRGDSLEYVLVDQLTNARAPVFYRVDRVDGENIYFNQGSRIEKFDGQVVSVSSPVGGVFDAASPPGGWARVDLQDGASWRVDYMGIGAEKIRYQLDATVMGSETVQVDGVDTGARQILYTGWMYAQAGATQPLPSRFRANVLYSTDLGRVVKFDAEYRRGVGNTYRESLELVRVWR